MSLSAATKRKPLNCEVIYMILTHSSHFCLWITDSLNLWISLKMYQMQQRLSIYVCVFINSSHRLQSKESFMWSREGRETRKVWTHSSFHVSVFLLLCTLWTQTEDIRYTKQDIWNYKEDQSKHVLYFRCLKSGWYHVSHQWDSVMTHLHHTHPLLLLLCHKYRKWPHFISFCTISKPSVFCLCWQSETLKIFILWKIFIFFFWCFIVV